MDPLSGLGPAHDVQLSAGTIRYHDVGSGPVLLFVHGVLAGPVLWRDVVPRLAHRFRCITPNLPLGGHPFPLRPDAARSPGGAADLLAELMQQLDLRDVTLVGNDTGGAISQITIARHPERIRRLVLTNCDCYEAFFPLPLQGFQIGPRLLGTRFGDLLAVPLRRRFWQRALLSIVAKRRMDEPVLDAYFRQFLADKAVRDDLIRFLATVSKRWTLEAATSFPSFEHPVLLAWGTNDRVFSARYARRLQRDFPRATLTFIPGSRAFVPEDQPERLAGLIDAFIPATVPESEAT